MEVTIFPGSHFIAAVATINGFQDKILIYKDIQAENHEKPKLGFSTSISGDGCAGCTVVLDMEYPFFGTEKFQSTHF